MRVIKENDSILLGLLIGATIPLLGYFAVDAIIDVLKNMNILDAPSYGENLAQGTRTKALIAICFNIIPLQFLKGRYYESTARGILLATFLYAGAWLAKFAPVLFKT